MVAKKPKNPKNGYFLGRSWGGKENNGASYGSLKKYHQLGLKAGVN